MKRLSLKKISRKKKQDEQTNSRITNETVAEHRERILAGGRRFKYPHQYVRHKLVINAILISIVAVIAVGVVGWWQLYKVQNTSEFMYRITNVLPVPVASVDGENIRYSDYLMRYRSQELWLRTKGQMNLSGEDGKRQLDFIKRSVFDGLVTDTYAQKRAHDLNITVSGQDVQTLIDNSRNMATGKISEDVNYNSIKDTLGFSPDEYKHILEQSLLRQRVAYAVDTKAQSVKSDIASELREDPKASLSKVADAHKKKSETVEFGASGYVSKNNQDGGLSEAALHLKNGEISPAIESTTGDGYYFVQRLGANDREVSYQYIRIPLTVFNNQIEKLQKDGKVHEYIDVPAVTQQTAS